MLQPPRHHRLVGRMILDHQHPRLAQRGGQQRGLVLLGQQRRRVLAAGLDQRDPHFGARAFAQRAVQGQFALHHLHQALADAQAQAGAAVVTLDVGAGLGEWREQVLQLFRCDAHAGVGHAQAQRLHTVLAGRPQHLQLQAHLALAGELDGIAEQVEHDLAQPYAVHFVGRRQLGIDLHVQRQATRAGLRGQQAAHAFQQGPQRLRHRLQAQCTCFQPRVVEDVVEDLPQHLRRILDHAEDALLLAVQRRMRQHLQHAQHATHGRADLVAHRGQETRFGFRSLLGLCLRRRQRIGLHPRFGHIHPVAAPDHRALFGGIGWPGCAPSACLPHRCAGGTPGPTVRTAARPVRWNAGCARGRPARCVPAAASHPVRPAAG